MEADTHCFLYVKEENVAPFYLANKIKMWHYKH